jgi:protoheme IX farnesyltransferase
MSGNALVLDSITDGSIVSDAKAARVAKPHIASDYVELTKPRIVMMILIVTAMSAIVAAGWELSGWMLFHLMLGTTLVAGSAGVLNQVVEKEVDSRMARTRYRPLPDDRVSRVFAGLFGMLLIAAGTVYLAMMVGEIPALLGLATWILYVAVYTPMKTRTEWNTTVGAIAGALPMLMGYTAAGGGLWDLQGWLLFGVLFLWQYPHFMAIAWMYRYDYGAAGLKMTPVVEPTGRRAGWQAVGGSLLLVLIQVSLVAAGSWGWLFALLVTAVTVKYVIASFRFARQPDDLTARRLLRASIAQLPAAMVVLVISALV